MQALSIKVKALVIFIVSITLVAALSLVVVIYKSYQLASKQSSDQKELILRATCKFNQAAKPISSKLNFLTF